MQSIDIPYEKYTELMEGAKKIAKAFETIKNNISIFTLSNPDNLSATGIIVNIVRKLELGAHVSFFRDAEEVKRKQKKLSYSNYCFLGFEISDIPKNILKEKSSLVIVINHKLKSQGNKKETNTQETDNLFVFSLEDIEIQQEALSTTGLAYFISANFYEDYQKFASLAIIGALHNEQKDHKQELIGLTKLILDEGKEKNFITLTKGTRIHGREKQPIHLALKYSLNPYFPGLTGNEKACTSFIAKLGIPMRDTEGEWRTISSLSKEEITKLNDNLISLLIEKQKQDITEVYKLIGPIYLSNLEQKTSLAHNIEEFMWLIDGACHLKKESLALAVILGDRKNLHDQLSRELQDYHGITADFVEQLEKKPEMVEDKGYYRLIKEIEHFDKTSVVSRIIKSLVDSSIIPIDKPIIVPIANEDEIDILIYESPQLIEKGIQVYHILQDLKKEKLIKRLSGDYNYIEASVDKENETVVIKRIENKLEYHFQGQKQ